MKYVLTLPKSGLTFTSWCAEFFFAMNTFKRVLCNNRGWTFALVYPNHAHPLHKKCCSQKSLFSEKERGKEQYPATYYR